MEPRIVVQVLRRADVLGSLPEPFLAEIAGLATTVRHASGAHVFRRGDPGEAMYIVSTGELRASVEAENGQETVLALLGPGALFGELALLDGRPRSASVYVVEDAHLVRIARAPLLALIRNRHDLAMALITGLAGRVRALTRDVEEGASLSARARLVRHLLRLGELHGSPGAGGVHIDAHLPQSVLASSLGLSRQTVNRLLQELQDLGLIAVHRARIILIDPERLDTSLERRLHK